MASSSDAVINDEPHDSNNSTNTSINPCSCCFLGIVTGPSEDDTATTIPKWLSTTTFEAPGDTTDEACSSISLMGPSRVFLAGSAAGETGVLGVLRDPGENKALEYGMVLDVRLDYTEDASTNQTVGASALLMGGRLINKEKVQYPIALVTDNENDNEIVNLVSLFSTYKVNNTDFVQAYPNLDPLVPNAPQPDYTTNGLFRYGTKYGIFTAQYIAKSLPDVQDASSSSSSSSSSRALVNTLGEDWILESGSTGEPIYASGILRVRDDGDGGTNRVLVAGYTRARIGLNFATSSSSSSSNANDMNGFVAVRDAYDGSNINGLNTIRIESSDGGDDYILGMCQCENTTTTTTSSTTIKAFFVVGYTNGIFDNALLKPTQSHGTTAFLIKLNALTLETIWIQQLGAPNLAAEVEGVACSVTNDNEVVYIAGNIKGNTTSSSSSFEGQEPWGDDDVFVAQYTTDNGKLNYIKQVGSPAKDSLTRGGIVTDRNGNALIMASTFGSWFRSRQDDNSEQQHAPYSDIVIMSISKSSGSFRFPGPVPTLPPAMQPGTVGSSTGSSSSSSPARGVRFTALIVVAVLGVIILIYVRSRHHPTELVETDRTKVLAYLKDFDVEDIDLRHSATGGWHCTYASNPAEKEHYRYFGIGGDEDDEEEDAIVFTGMRQLVTTTPPPYRSGSGSGYVDPLHAPLTTSSTTNNNNNIGGGGGSTSAMVVGRSPAALASVRKTTITTNFVGDSLLLDESDNARRTRRRGSNYHGLGDTTSTTNASDTGFQPLGGGGGGGSDNHHQEPKSRYQRRRSMNEETWGKDII